MSSRVRTRCRTCSVRSLTSQSGGVRGSSERADPAGPALARGVSSVSWGAPSLCGLADSIPRSVRPLFDDAPQRVAVVLVPSAHDASNRASVAAASALRAITRAAGVASEPPGDCPGRRSRAEDPSFLRHLRFFTKLTWHHGVFGLSVILSITPCSGPLHWS